MCVDCFLVHIVQNTVQYGTQVFNFSTLKKSFTGYLLTFQDTFQKHFSRNNKNIREKIHLWHFISLRYSFEADLISLH